MSPADNSWVIALAALCLGVTCAGRAWGPAAVCALSLAAALLWLR